MKRVLLAVVVVLSSSFVMEAVALAQEPPAGEGKEAAPKDEEKEKEAAPPPGEKPAPPPPDPKPEEKKPDEPKPEEKKPEEPPASAPAVSPEASAAAKALFAEELRKRLQKARSDQKEKLVKKMEAKQEVQMERITDILNYLSVAGLLLLFTPLFLRKKFPGKGGLLFKYSAIAAVTFVVAVQLLSVALILLRSTQHAMAEYTNPQIDAMDGIFDALEKNAGELQDIAPIFVEPMLSSIEGGSDQDAIVVLLENLQKLNESAKVFMTIADMFKGLNWLFAMVPTILAFLAVALFVKVFYPVLKDIVLLPMTVAAGDADAGKRVLKKTFKAIGWELVATLVMVIVLVATATLGGVVLAETMEEVMEAIISFFFLAFIYLQQTPDAATGLVLGGSIVISLFLVFVLGIVIALTIIYMGKAHGIFRKKFHDKVPLKAQKRFWIWGTISIFWAMALPFLFMKGAGPLLDKMLPAFLPDKLLMAMLVGAAILTFGFLILFWAVRGLKAIVWLAKYKPVNKPPEALPGPPPQAQSAA